MAKNCIIPGDENYFNDIDELSGFILDAINNGAVRAASEKDGYLFKISDLPFDIEKKSYHIIANAIADSIIRYLRGFDNIFEDNSDEKPCVSIDNSVIAMFREKYLVIKFRG